MASLQGVVAALALGLFVLEMAGAALVYQPVAVPAHHHVELRSVREQPQGAFLLHSLYPAQVVAAPESSHVRVVRSPTKYKFGGIGGFGGKGGYGGGYPGGYGGHGGGYPGGYGGHGGRYPVGGYGGGCNTCGGGSGGYPSYGGSYSQSSSQASSQSSSGSVGWGRRR
ncbi:glycine-rich cell wall structural protein-like [Schistocerca piceifrons]|uniref:glycine-rich cell wall structural protein-like n=1 Tax=Schistocerca piceifrons TaxID=274613 RepID=UPI001F5E43DC|nr:glycine-rich cell wall structural protein-like [Schistocerca piceifrons]